MNITTFNGAKDIKEGQLFIAKKSTVEGREKVTLVPVDETDYYDRQDNPEKYEELDPSEQYHATENDESFEKEKRDWVELDEDSEREAIEEELEYRIKMEGHQ